MPADETPHELTDNTCPSLQHRGAQAVLAPHRLPAGSPDDVLRDGLLPDGASDAADCPGHHGLASYRALFVSTMQADLAKMEHALKARDVDLLAKMLHRMRGALSVMRIKAWTARIEALEAALRNAGLNAGTLEEAKALATSLRDMLAKL